MKTNKFWDFKFPKKVLSNFNLKQFGGKRDWDFDGVINSKDCQPKNTMRQDWDVERARKVGQYVVGMTPREYLRRTFVTPSMMEEARKDKTHWLSMYSDVKTQKREPLTKLQEYIKSPTEKVPIPFVYYNYGQEGRHRALAAEQLGLKTIPVAVQRPFTHTQPDVAEAFVQKAFPKAHITYKREWEERFKKGSPEHYMDLETFNKYKEVLEERGYKDVTGTYEDLQPASIEKQQEWRTMPQEQQYVERTLKYDTDMDGVPNEYDCQPEDSTKQEDWEVELDYVASGIKPMMIYGWPANEVDTKTLQQIKYRADKKGLIVKEEENTIVDDYKTKDIIVVNPQHNFKGGFFDYAKSKGGEGYALGYPKKVVEQWKQQNIPGSRLHEKWVNYFVSQGIPKEDLYFLEYVPIGMSVEEVKKAIAERKAVTTHQPTRRF